MANIRRLGNAGFGLGRHELTMGLVSGNWLLRATHGAFDFPKFVRIRVISKSNCRTVIKNVFLCGQLVPRVKSHVVEIYQDMSFLGATVRVVRTVIHWKIVWSCVVTLPMFFLYFRFFPGIFYLFVFNCAELPS